VVDDSGMRVQYWFATAVTVISLAVSQASDGWAAQQNEALPEVRLIGSNQDVKPRDGARYLEIGKTTKPCETTGPARAPSLKDLFFKSDSSTTNSKTSDAIAIEPWMPGRGSLGVKVEVTW
jgi:hypothetical protein